MKKILILCVLVILGSCSQTENSDKENNQRLFEGNPVEIEKLSNQPNI